jgi:hypothetical protein
LVTLQKDPALVRKWTRKDLMFLYERGIYRFQSMSRPGSHQRAHGEVFRE